MKLELLVLVKLDNEKICWICLTCIVVPTSGLCIVSKSFVSYHGKLNNMRSVLDCGYIYLLMFTTEEAVMIKNNHDHNKRLVIALLSLILASVLL